MFNTHVSTYTKRNEYTHIHMHLYYKVHIFNVHSSTYTKRITCTETHIYYNVHTFNPYVFIYTKRNVHTHTHTRARAHTHTHIYIYIPMYICIIHMGPHIVNGMCTHTQMNIYIYIYIFVYNTFYRDHRYYSCILIFIRFPRRQIRHKLGLTWGPAGIPAGLKKLPTHPYMCCEVMSLLRLSTYSAMVLPWGWVPRKTFVSFFATSCLKTRTRTGGIEIIAWIPAWRPRHYIRILGYSTCVCSCDFRQNTKMVHFDLSQNTRGCNFDRSQSA